MAISPSTVGSGIVSPPSIGLHVIFGALVGATIVKACIGSLIASGILKTASFIVVSPILGITLSLLITVAQSCMFFRSTPRRVDLRFRRSQLLSSALYSVGHGSNDARQTMGIVWLLLIAAAITTRDHLPTWVLTIPAAGLMSAAAWSVEHSFRYWL